MQHQYEHQGLPHDMASCPEARELRGWKGSSVPRPSCQSAHASCGGGCLMSSQEAHLRRDGHVPHQRGADVRLRRRHGRPRGHGVLAAARRQRHQVAVLKVVMQLLSGPGPRRHRARQGGLRSSVDLTLRLARGACCCGDGDALKCRVGALHTGTGALYPVNAASADRHYCHPRSRVHTMHLTESTPYLMCVYCTRIPNKVAPALASGHRRRVRSSHWTPPTARPAAAKETACSLCASCDACYPRESRRRTCSSSEAGLRVTRGLCECVTRPKLRSQSGIGSSSQI